MEKEKSASYKKEAFENAQKTVNRNPEIWDIAQITSIEPVEGEAPTMAYKIFLSGQRGEYIKYIPEAQKHLIDQLDLEKDPNEEFIVALAKEKSGKLLHEGKNYLAGYVLRDGEDWGEKFDGKNTYQVFYDAVQELLNNDEIQEKHFLESPQSQTGREWFSGIIGAVRHVKRQVKKILPKEGPSFREDD